MIIGAMEYRQDPLDMEYAGAIQLHLHPPSGPGHYSGRALSGQSLALDSVLDLITGGILWFTHLSLKNINIYKYPIGKLRVQPVGIIIFAAIMATLN
ncbi:hypothetical protein ABFX02_08G217800 [Erythranthe guttata]